MHNCKCLVEKLCSTSSVSASPVMCFPTDILRGFRIIPGKTRVWLASPAASSSFTVNRRILKGRVGCSMTFSSYGLALTSTGRIEQDKHGAHWICAPVLNSRSITDCCLAGPIVGLCFERRNRYNKNRG